jgi:hypothetical protein
MSQDWRNKAILVRLTVGSWSGNAGQRKCRQIAAEVEQQHGTAHGKIKADAELLAKEDRAAVQAIVSEGRSYYYSVTVPWDDRGWRMLPARLFVEFKERMTQLGARLEQAVQETILNRYFELKDKAERCLNGLAQKVEFPSQENLAKRFNWKVAVEQLPRPEDLRVECLTDFQMEQLREEMRQRQESQLRAGVSAMVEQLRALVANLAEQLRRRDECEATSAERRVPIHDSLIENIREACRVLPGLNISGDPFLANLIQRVQNELAGFEVEELRASRMRRKEAQHKASSLLADLANYQSEVPDVLETCAA